MVNKITWRLLCTEFYADRSRNAEQAVINALGTLKLALTVPFLFSHETHACSGTLREKLLYGIS
jgi:hypothetical protein